MQPWNRKRSVGNDPGCFAGKCHEKGHCHCSPWQTCHGVVEHLCRCGAQLIITQQQFSRCARPLRFSKRCTNLRDSNPIWVAKCILLGRAFKIFLTRISIIKHHTFEMAQCLEVNHLFPSKLLRYSVHLTIVLVHREWKLEQCTCHDRGFVDHPCRSWCLLLRLCTLV